MTAPSPAAVLVARARWRSAEDQLYPSLLNDPTAYQRGVAAVQAVVEELRRSTDDVADLLAVDAEPHEVLAAACPSGFPISPMLLIAVACSMRDREITADQQARRRDEAVRTARAAGAAWAVLDGPADIAELTEGRRVAVHLASGTVVETTVDPWARDEQFGLAVRPGEVQTFGDRDAWLTAVASASTDVEKSGDAAP